MNHREAIRARRSRRHYLDTPLSEEHRMALVLRMRHFNEEAGLSMAWIDDGGQAFHDFSKSYGMFSNIRSMLVMKGPKDDPHLLEKLGSYGEFLILEATILGLGTCWVSGTFDRENDLFVPPADETFVCVITIGNVRGERAVGERLVSRISMGRRRSARELYESNETPPDWFLEGVEAVRLAPSAVNRQPVQLSWKEGEARAVVRSGAAHELVDLGIAKTHFALACGGGFALGNGGLFHKN